MGLGLEMGLAIVVRGGGVSNRGLVLGSEGPGCLD